MVPALLAAGSAGAAEIYNKEGNKLDLFGKVDGLHYFSNNSDSDGDKSYMRLGFKGETQISDLLTGYGQWEYQAALNTTEAEGTANSFTRVGFAGLKFGDADPLIMAVTTACSTTSEPGPTYCRSSAGILTVRTTSCSSAAAAWRPIVTTISLDWLMA